MPRYVVVGRPLAVNEDSSDGKKMRTSPAPSEVDGERERRPSGASARRSARVSARIAREDPSRISENRAAKATPPGGDRYSVCSRQRLRAIGEDNAATDHSGVTYGPERRSSPLTSPTARSLASPSSARGWSRGQARRRRSAGFDYFRAAGPCIASFATCSAPSKARIGRRSCPDLRFGQPRRVALPSGVPLAKIGIDLLLNVLPESGIGPIRTVDPPTDPCVDLFDQTTQSGADHDTDADVVVHRSIRIHALVPLEMGGAPRDAPRATPRASSRRRSRVTGVVSGVEHFAPCTRARGRGASHRAARLSPGVTSSGRPSVGEATTGCVHERPVASGRGRAAAPWRPGQGAEDSRWSQRNGANAARVQHGSRDMDRSFSYILTPAPVCQRRHEVTPERDGKLVLGHTLRASCRIAACPRAPPMTPDTGRADRRRLTVGVGRSWRSAGAFSKPSIVMRAGLSTLGHSDVVFPAKYTSRPPAGVAKNFPATIAFRVRDIPHAARGAACVPCDGGLETSQGVSRTACDLAGVLRPTPSSGNHAAA